MDVRSKRRALEATIPSGSQTTLLTLPSSIIYTKTSADLLFMMNINLANINFYIRLDSNIIGFMALFI